MYLADLKLISSVLNLKQPLLVNLVWVKGEEELILCFFHYETKNHQILPFSLRGFFGFFFPSSFFIQRAGVEYPYPHPSDLFSNRLQTVKSSDFFIPIPSVSWIRNPVLLSSGRKEQWQGATAERSPIKWTWKNALPRKGHALSNGQGFSLACSYFSYYFWDIQALKSSSGMGSQVSAGILWTFPALTQWMVTQVLNTNTSKEKILLFIQCWYTWPQTLFFSW